jgi:hypothetical protein
LKNYRFFTRPLLILFLLQITTGHLNAQDVDASAKYGIRDYVKDLKNGIILVRLQDKTASLELLKARGLKKEAQKLEEAQALENKETMLSFAGAFSFCPVYFFYAKDSESIRIGDFNDKLFDVDFNIAQAPLHVKVFIAEFSETEILGIDGLIIMDSQLLALKDPLPYFERRFVFLSLFERSKAKMIEVYNKRMHDYAEMYL